MQFAPRILGDGVPYETKTGVFFTGVRYSGELGHPFHVVDDDLVILSLDDPYIPEGRFAPLLVRDQEPAQNLAAGFQKLWSKAMPNLRDIDFHPGVSVKQK